LHVSVGVEQKLGPLVVHQGLTGLAVEGVHVVLPEDVQHVRVHTLLFGKFTLQLVDFPLLQLAGLVP